MLIYENSQDYDFSSVSRKDSSKRAIQVNISKRKGQKEKKLLNNTEYRIFREQTSIESSRYYTNSTEKVRLNMNITKNVYSHRSKRKST